VTEGDYLAKGSVFSLLAFALFTAAAAIVRSADCLLRRLRKTDRNHCAGETSRLRKKRGQS